MVTPDLGWFQAVEKSWAPWGVVERHDGDASLRRISEQKCAFVIVDAAFVDNLGAVISRIVRESPDARVVVASASPSWRSAREALLAGAADYIRRTTDVDYLSDRWRQIVVHADARHDDAAVGEAP